MANEAGHRRPEARRHVEFVDDATQLAVQRLDLVEGDVCVA
ncbi:MAG TPA: hypothetical protein VF391_12810 [Dermatophilaceae bacterium]